MTDIINAMENRHAVRAYDPEKKIPKEITDMLREKIDLLNAESKLHIQLVTDEPKAFDSLYFWRHSLDLTAVGLQCHTLR